MQVVNMLVHEVGPVPTRPCSRVRAGRPAAAGGVTGGVCSAVGVGRGHLRVKWAPQGEKHTVFREEEGQCSIID